MSGAKEASRLDKWLWAVRLCKTRTQAADACRLSRVSAGGQPVKPSREVKAGDVFLVQQPHILRTVRVKALPKSRVGAKLVPDYREGLTPPERIERARRLAEEARLARPVFDAGAGRPTKADRREWERIAELNAGVDDGDDADEE